MQIKYGLISKVDASVLERTIDLIKSDTIFVTEIGIYGGETGNGLMEYMDRKGRKSYITGIDNNKDGEKVRFPCYNRIIDGDSREVYWMLKDESQDLIFVDGCHCFSCVVSDFFCYAPKIKVGGYFAFHD